MIYRLASYHNGLGDNIQFSTIPEELTKLGHEVYLLEDPNEDQVKRPRNFEIKALIWDTNPYVKGIIPGPWSAGDLPETIMFGGLKISTNQHRYFNKTGSFIRNWEFIHGIEPKNDFPKIYHKPKKIPGIEGIIELSSISLRYNHTMVENLAKRMMSQFPAIQFKQIISPNQNGRIVVHNEGTSGRYAEDLKINGLFDLFDVISNCKIFISLNSGAHSLAAAAREYNKTMLQYCILPVEDHDWILESKKFVYPGITYVKENTEF